MDYIGGYRCPSQALPPNHGCPQDAAGHHPLAAGAPSSRLRLRLHPPHWESLLTQWVLQRFNKYRKYNRLYTCFS